MNEQWRPAASLQLLKKRAHLLARIRAFFAAREVLEVETPVLSAAAITDSHLSSFTSHYQGPGAAQGKMLYLHTSPEFPMKRLLAAGAGAIYQVCRVFRQGEVGRLHNPEFTMLEWYRPGFDHYVLMDEVAALMRELLPQALLSDDIERLTYAEAFQRFAHIDPHVATVAEFHACADAHGLPTVAGLGDDIDGWRDLLLTHVVEPQLKGLVFIYDYPASQAALAKIREGTEVTPAVAERFELYCNGVELANGFHELLDADEQRARFLAENEQRKSAGLVEVPVDELLLAAMAKGLPPCAGVALGIDRLVMVATNSKAISEVMAFPLDRA